MAREYWRVKEYKIVSRCAMGCSVWPVRLGPLLDDQQGQMANFSQILTRCTVWLIDRARRPVLSCGIVETTFFTGSPLLPVVDIEER